MAPRPSGARRSLFPEPEHVYELGVAGRKTGVTLKDSGVRDEHGMQPLEDLFSSPQKPTEDRDEDEPEDEEDGGASEDGRADSEDMDITTSTFPSHVYVNARRAIANSLFHSTASGIAPAALLNGNASRLPLPVNRTNRSPVKVVVNSPARNRLMARSSSPTRGSLGASKENYDRGSSSQPVEDINTARRKLNFEALKAGGRSLSQPTTTNGINGLNGYHDEAEEDETENAAAPDETDAFIEESMAILEDDGEVEEEQPVEQEQEQEQEQEEEEPEPSPEVASAPAAKKKPGRKPNAKEPSPAPAPAKRGRKPAAPVVEEEEQEETEEAAEEEADEEPEEVAPKVAAKRGRGAKGKAAAVEEPVATAKPGRKRRTVEEPATDAEDSSASRQSKRQRTIETAPAPAARGRGRPKKSLTPAPEEDVEEPEPEPVQAGPSRSKAATKGKGRAPTPAAEPVNPKATKQKGGRKRQPSPAPAADADTSIAIPRGPPLPKSRGLVINRREVPGDSNAIIRTRSGRHSFKPLAYWRNEHVDYEYEEDEFVADHAPKSSSSSSSQTGKEVRKRKFVLPTIKEVVRVEEEVVDFSRGRSGRGKRSAASASSGRRGAQQQKDDDPSPPEPWELNPGILGGDVVTWYPQHELHPPALDDEVEVSEKQLAISGRAIRTQKVKDAAFRYAKTVNEGFFGAGVVDLPPGAVKRPKNSRKMFMTFFVYTGRVLVTVNETVFRIGKGGMWFVPRGEFFFFFFSPRLSVGMRRMITDMGENDDR